MPKLKLTSCRNSTGHPCPPPPATASPCAPDDSDPALVTVERGDLPVRGFFCRGWDAIFCIRLQDLDAQTCVNKDPQKCLIASEDAKKKKHQKKCHECFREFVPFVVSFNGMFGPKAINTLKWIAQLLSEKWWRPYSSTFGSVKSRMSMTVARATNICLRGTRMKNHSLDNRRYLWDEEGLYRLHNQHF